MAGPLGRGQGPIAAINVTPFVDVVLVLLVILMVSSVKIVNDYMAAFDVDLPSAASGGQTVESTLNLVIKADGTLQVDGVVTNADGLAKYVRAQRARNPEVRAVIGADRRVEYDRVIAALDLIKSNGVSTFALNLKQSTPPSAPASSVQGNDKVDGT